MANPKPKLENLKKFKKGFDPRRNVRGVPSDAIAMRQHIKQIASELIGSGSTEMTRLDAMLRQVFSSRNPAHNKLALQVFDPKILQGHLDLTSAGQPIQIKNHHIFHDGIKPSPHYSIVNTCTSSSNTPNNRISIYNA